MSELKINTKKFNDLDKNLTDLKKSETIVLYTARGTTVKFWKKNIEPNLLKDNRMEIKSEYINEAIINYD